MKKRFLLTAVLAVYLVLLLSFAHATQLRMDFSADITYTSGDFSDYISGDTVSGYVLYDSETVAAYESADWISFDSDSFSTLPASIYIDQLDVSFNVVDWNYADDSDVSGFYSMSIWTDDSQEIGGEQTSLYLDLSSHYSFFDWASSLPTSIDQTVVGSYDLWGGVWFSNSMNSEYTDLLIHSLTVVPFSGDTLPDFPAPVINADSNLLLGGDGLASGARMNEGDADLVTNKTTVGYTSEGFFVQTGASHKADDLLIGGDSDYYNTFETSSGEYTMTGGVLETGATQIGYHDEGIFKQTGGVHTTNWLMVGNTGSESPHSGPRADGVGTYNLESGTLTSSRARIGASGQGTFNQSGGIHTVGYSYYPTSAYDLLFLTIGSGSSTYNPDDYTIPDYEKRYGMYNLSGGELTVYGSVTVGTGSNYNNYGGLGSFNQSGGTASMHNLIVGESGTAASGEGHVTVSGDAVMNLSGSIFVGVASGAAPSVASFEQTGGMVTVNEKIIIGESAAGKEGNAYRILGGQATVSNGVEVGTGEIDLGRAELEVGNGGILTADVFVKNNGIIKGNAGTIFGDIFMNGGIIAPGNSPGIMTIDGDLILNEGTLQVEAYGTGEQDLLNVTGTVYFGDNAAIDLMFGYKPAITVVVEDFFSINTLFQFGDGFDPQTAIGFSFLDSIILLDGETFAYSLGSQEYQYTYMSSVPLPSSAWFLLTGVLGILSIRGRQRGIHSA